MGSALSHRNLVGFLAYRLKEERKKLKLSQKALAKLTGLGLKTIRKIEQDDQSVSMCKVNRLLNFFGLELGPKKLLTSPVNKIKYDLCQEDIIKVLNGVFPIFKLKYGISNLGLFGSFARNEEALSSDIDIIFEGDTSFSSEGQMTLILEHLLVGHGIDFTNKANLDPRLRESILEDVIYV